MTLTLDIDGVIRSASLANTVASEVVDKWVGQAWVNTVAEFGGEAVRGMVADARALGVSDFRHITQRFPSGLELKVEYHTVRLGGQAGLVAVGRSLQAVADVQARMMVSQQAREQDAWKLRELETRNRLLFDSSDDPILLVRLADYSVIEANPAAVRTGVLDSGGHFPGAIARQDLEAFTTMMAQVRDQGRAQGIVVHIGAAAAPFLLRASRASAELDTVLLLRMSPAQAPAWRGAALLDELVEHMPDGFALVDAAGLLRRANRAFLDLVQIAAPAAALGEPIARWMATPGADAETLLELTARQGVVRNFTTALHGELGAVATVEVSAVLHRETRQFGLLLHDITRRRDGAKPRAAAPEAVTPSLAPLAQLSDQIGRTPLMQLVRETSDLIEQHCIVAALARVDGNRTAAAGLLGLSRQSLYGKLAKHSLGGGAEDSNGG